MESFPKSGSSAHKLALEEVRRAADSSALGKGGWLDNFWHVSAKDLIRFCRNVATMLKAGLPLEQILIRQQRYMRRGKLRNSIAKLHRDLLAGKPFGDALAAQPEVFDDLFVNLLIAGEQGGQLDFALTQVADALERKLEIQRKVLPLMVYPAFVLLVALGDAALFMGVILPMILKLARQQLGEPTGLLLWMTWLTSYWWVGVILFLLAGVGTVCFLRTPTGRELWDEGILYVPVFNDAVCATQSAYFVMGVLMAYKAGLSLSVAAKLGRKALTNQSVQAVFVGLEERVDAGMPLGEALSEVDYLPGDILEMIDTGETSGTLQDMLNIALETLMQDINARLSLILAILQPLLVVGMILLIGSVLLLIYVTVFATFGGILKQAVG